MTQNEQISLHRWRNLGETFTDVLQLIRLNGKPLLLGILFIAVPIILLSGLGLVLLFPNFFSLTEEINLGPFWDNAMVNEVLIRTSLNILYFSICVAPVSIIAFVVLHLYNQKGRPPTFEELRNSFFRNFLSLMVAKALMFPFILFPGLLFVIPGLAFFTLFGCVELLILEKQMGVWAAVGKSFEVMGRHFWSSLWINMVMIFVFFVGTLALDLPLTLLEAMEGITSYEIRDSGFWDIASKVMFVLKQVLGSILYVLPTLAVGLRYYSIMERLDNTWLRKRVAEIGQDREQQDVYAEEEKY